MNRRWGLIPAPLPQMHLGQKRMESIEMGLPFNQPYADTITKQMAAPNLQLSQR